MAKTRILTPLLTLALALTTAPVVLAQDGSPAPEEASSSSFDPSGIEGWNEEAGLLLMHEMNEALRLMGVAEEDLDAAVDYLQGAYADLSEEALASLDEEVAGEMDEATDEMAEAEEEVTEEMAEAEDEVADEMAEAEDEVAEAREEIEEEKEEAKEQISD